jgi:hypothetical protein
MIVIMGIFMRMAMTVIVRVRMVMFLTVTHKLTPFNKLSRTTGSGIC